MKNFNKIMGMCALAGVVAGCRTTNSVTGEAEYTPFGRIANSAISGTAGLFTGMVNGAAEGWNKQEGTNEVSVAGRLWNATIASTIGMVEGAAKEGKDGYNLTVQETDRRRAEETAARNAMWEAKRLEATKAQSR